MATIDLRGLLANAGISILRVTNTRKGTEYWGLCPKHKERTGKDDRHPSWSINNKTFKHNCFSCGYAGSIQSLLNDVTGRAPDDLDKQLAKEGFLQQMEELRESPEELVEGIEIPLTEWVLHKQYRDVPQHMLDLKHLQRFAVDAYEVRWDKEKKKAARWVLPLRDLDGELIGAQYRQKGNVLTLPTGVEKSTTLFGYHQCEEFNHVVIVESPLDAVRLFGLGIPALSSLGAWTSLDQASILARTFRRIYLAFDNDKSGHIAVDVITPRLRKAGAAPLYWDLEGLEDEEGEPAKDPGDVWSDEALLASWERTVRMGL